VLRLSAISRSAQDAVGGYEPPPAFRWSKKPGFLPLTGGRKLSFAYHLLKDESGLFIVVFRRCLNALLGFCRVFRACGRDQGFALDLSLSRKRPKLLIRDLGIPHLLLALGAVAFLFRF
jgi:hypothetical protein